MVENFRGFELSQVQMVQDVLEPYFIDVDHHIDGTKSVDGPFHVGIPLIVRVSLIIFQSVVELITNLKSSIGI